MDKCTATAHTNIALIKYWGKADAALNLPTTSSLSMTLDKFYTTTSVSFDENLSADSLVLNGAAADSGRVQQFLEIFRLQFGNFPSVLIGSENHVPTAAGLASSASSFAALTAAMNGLLGLELSLQDLSRLARRGSGSATRSIFGNFAIWHKGTDDTSSFAESFLNEDIGLSMIVAEVSSGSKKISSSFGMQRAQTSPDYAAWIKQSAADLTDIEKAILSRDIEKIGAISENNALAMHALNRSAREPFDYFTDKTRALIAFVQDCRKQGLLAFVTIDAGPNVKIITDKNTEEKLLAELQQHFPELTFDIAHAGAGISYADD